MRIRLARREELFLPLLLLAPAACGRAREVAALLAALTLMRLATLCAAEGFRTAAAQEIAPRRVRGAWTGALLATLALGAAAWRWGGAAWQWLFCAEADARLWTQMCACGGALALSRLNREHLRAAGQGGSAVLCAFLNAVLLAGALLCGGPLWWLCAAALDWVISLLIACAVGGNPLGAPNGLALLRMPGATLRALLYPLPGLLLLLGGLRTDALHATAGYLLGLAAYGCAASAFRRNREESAPLNLWLLGPAALLCAATPFLPAPARLVALIYTCAAVAAMLVNAALRPFAALATLLTCAACAAVWLSRDGRVWPAPVCAAAALAALFPDLRRVHRRRRAMRIKNKRSK